MKLSIPRDKLIVALAAVKSAVGKGSQPILSNILLAAGENTLTLTATDLDVFLRCRSEALVAAAGKATIRADLLFNFLKLSDGAEVKIEMLKRNIVIECGNTRHSLTTLDADDFPGFPNIEQRARNKKDSKDPEEKAAAEVVAFELEDSVFRQMLSETSYATAHDDDANRAVLNGMLIRIGHNPGKLEVVACDGRRVAVSAVDCPAAAKAALIAPSKATRELSRLLGNDVDKPQKLSVTTGANLVQFEFKSDEMDVTLVSKLIAGVYPPFERVLPPENLIATLTRAELLRSIERIALVADNVTLAFGASELRLTSDGKRGEEFLGKANDSLPVSANQDAEATYSARYLKDTLTAIADDQVQFHISPRNVAMFTAPGRDWRGVVAAIVKEAKARPAEETKPEPAAKAA